MIKRIKELTIKLNAANHAYYNLNNEIMSDFEYDKLYDELVSLERKEGIILSNSPTSKVGYEVVGALTKVIHDIPLLSLDKTKEISVLEAFLENEQGLLSWKLDGLSIVLKYEDGRLFQALTRGNGQIGEDVTHNARVFTNIPLKIPFKGKVSIRGEAVITQKDFEEINVNNLYKNPRNLCSGAVRQLNSEITASRRVLFFAFNIMSIIGVEFEKKSDMKNWLIEIGFETVPSELVNAVNVSMFVEKFKNEVNNKPWSSDGLVLAYNDVKYSESLGATSKFPRDSLAFKWADEIAETTLTNIEWNTSRTGLINPVAVFEPVDLEGTTVSRASVHNLSILKELSLTTGDQISVYKANMIIPQVAENLTKHSFDILIPSNCPICDGETEIIGDPETLYCINPSCEAQQLKNLVHFVSRDGMNVAGLSEQTLEKFLEKEIITDYMSLFEIKKFEEIIVSMGGFGQKSFDKLINALENSKKISLPNFIYALGIRHVGLSNAKLLCKFYNHDATKIMEVCKSENFMEELLEVKGFGETIIISLNNYFNSEKNCKLYIKAVETFDFIPPTHVNKTLDGLTFVITGDVNEFKNRKTLSDYIETNGGKTSTSVSAKTSFLINNDNTSLSSKNKKAAELNVPIITEKEFLEKFFT